jgi:hypothetical protein
VAKRREFDEVGIGDFNVTIRSIHDHFVKNNLSLDMFPQRDFDNPPAERAVLFSSPGGLMRTAEREVPGIGSRTRKIEGPHTVYPYLQGLKASIDAGTAPLLVDCLSCEKGCNGGPGTLNRKTHPDTIEAPIEERDRRRPGCASTWKRTGIRSCTGANTTIPQAASISAIRTRASSMKSTKAPLRPGKRIS